MFFLYLLKILENYLQLSVFRGCKTETLLENRLEKQQMSDLAGQLLHVSTIWRAILLATTYEIRVRRAMRQVKTNGKFVQCSISITPENVWKPLVFLPFQGGMKMEHWAKLV